MITTQSDETVLVSVDTDNDGFADELFRFFALPAPSVSFYSGNASIEFRGDELIVISGETGELYAFSVGPPRLPQRVFGTGPSVSIFPGYGLNHEMGPHVNKIYMPWPQKGRRVPVSLLVPDDAPGGGGSGGCQSGGIGASSCSITAGGGSCSVSCVSGYYACCSQVADPICCSPYCRCIKY